MSYQMIHAAEAVPKSGGGAYMRCLGCGARQQCEAEDGFTAIEVAERLALEHRRTRGKPVPTAVLYGRKDSNNETVQETFTARDQQDDVARRALAEADWRRKDPHWWGWSWAILLGNATPEIFLPRQIEEDRPEIAAHAEMVGDAEEVPEIEARDDDIVLEIEG